MATEPSVIDLGLFRDLLVGQVRRGEITNAEAVRCWQIHAVPMLPWQKKQQVRAAITTAMLGEEPPDD